MSTSRAPLRALGLGLLAATTEAVTLPAGARVPDDPEYQMPGLAECRVLTYEDHQAPSDTTDTVDCADPHTSYVFAVELLPDSLDRDSSAAKLTHAVSAACLPVWEDHLGGSEKAREMSAYAMAWFMPTRAQRDRGAPWFRCDLVLLGGRKVLPLPGDTAPVLDTDLPDSVARCLTADPAVTTCARGHRWRATGGFRLRTDGYPTAEQFRRAAERRCPRLISTRRWRWEGPNRDAWRVGQRTMVCSSRTSD